MLERQIFFNANLYYTVLCEIKMQFGRTALAKKVFSKKKQNGGQEGNDAFPDSVPMMNWIFFLYVLNNILKRCKVITKLPVWFYLYFDAQIDVMDNS